MEIFLNERLELNHYIFGGIAYSRMKYNSVIHLLGATLLNGLAIYSAFYIAPTEVEMGELARILYFHVPSAAICYLSLSISFFSGIYYLISKKKKFDILSESSAFLGLVYGFITLIGGAIWAKSTWGVYWNWDPRETTTLILWISYLGYLFLRMSVSNPEREATVGAAYNVLAFLTVPLSYLSFIFWPSLHPRLTSEVEIGLTRSMLYTLIINLLAGIVLYSWFLEKAYRIRIMRNRLESLKSGAMNVI